MRNNANTCPWALLKINGDDCTYNGSNAALQTTYYMPDPWVGPSPSSAFYSSTIGTNKPLPGDSNKVEPDVTVDLAVGVGNVISGTIEIGAVAIHNFSAGASTGRGEETWASRTVILAPKAADIVNGNELIIGSFGFPAYLQPDPGLPGLFGDEFTSEQGADSNGSSADIPYWDPASHSNVGIATWEDESVAATATLGGGNRTPGTVASIGTTATHSSTGYGCVDTDLGTGGGGGACNSASALENRGGFENVLLKVQTDGAGGITGVEGILVQETLSVRNGRSWVAWRFSAAPADAMDDVYTVIQDSTNNILDVGANDVNFGSSTTASISLAPDQSGQAMEQNSPGDPTAITVSYSPVAGFSGTETFGYTMTDTETPPNTDAATVTVTVIPYGATDDSASTALNTPVTIPVGANDIGFAEPAEATISSPAGNGVATVTAGNSPGDPLNITVDYTPNPGFAGMDSFAYTMDDSVNPPDTATVTVNVVGNLVPVAPDAAVTTGEGFGIRIVVDDLSGVDFGDLPSTVVISTDPVNGSAVIDSGGGQWAVIYTPDLLFDGADAVGYTIEDIDGEMATGTIGISVGPPLVPKAVDDSFVVPPGVATTIDVRGSQDQQGSGAMINHTVQITQQPDHGSATVDADNLVIYTPDDGFNGDVDTFQYELTDENGDSDTATVTVTVTSFANSQLPAAKVSALSPLSLVSMIGFGWMLRRKRKES
jgi:hypothetical protein